jgi:CheY-like chemotaxis protein
MPVLIILQMPVMDGLTCVRRIREYEATGHIISHIPVIAITANARSEQINIAMEAGMDTVVTKPFRIPDLVPRMQSLLSEYPAK